MIAKSPINKPAPRSKTPVTPRDATRNKGLTRDKSSSRLEPTVADINKSNFAQKQTKTPKADVSVSSVNSKDNSTFIQEKFFRRYYEKENASYLLQEKVADAGILAWFA